MTNEKELLFLYTDKEGYRPALLHPFLQDGYVCATDAHVIIRIPAAKCEGKYTDTPNGQAPPRLAAAIPAPNTSETLTRQQLEDALRQAPEEENRQCPDCGGEGEVKWEYTDKMGTFHHHLDTCPVCNGTGEFDNLGAIKYQFSLHGACICYAHLKLLHRSMELLGAGTLTLRRKPEGAEDPEKPAKPLLFTADGVEIVVMPRLRDTRLQEIKVI